MKYITIITILLVLVALTHSRHHKKKKQTGFFGFFPDIPKLSSQLIKFAFKGSGDDSSLEEEHFDEGIECDHIEGKHKGKHRFHQDKKIVYRPYYVNHDYLPHAQAYPYQVSAPAQAYYASSHTTLIPIQEHAAYASQIPQSYEHGLSDYKVGDVHESLF
ncbi:hypothetical protein Trydic_g14649 [Trypoxylus dichotomus]